MKKINMMSIDRKTLYKEVWKEPMVTVAKRYEISNVALKKLCVKLNIPTPGLGYWAKVRAGAKPEIPPLPKGPKLPKEPELPKGLDLDSFFKELNMRMSKFDESHDFEMLQSEALDWELAMKIRDYICAVEFRMLTMKMSPSQRERIRKKIEWAKKKADWLDPITAYDDPLLGRNRYIRVFFGKD